MRTLSISWLIHKQIIICNPKSAIDKTNVISFTKTAKQYFSGWNSELLKKQMQFH